MNEQFNGIFIDSVKVIVGILIGYFFGEPLKRIGERIFKRREEVWDRKNRVARETRLRPRFRVTQLCDPGNPFDFSSILKEQNSCQEIFTFEVDDFRRFPKSESIEELRNLSSKKDFVDRIGKMLALMRGELWQGLKDQLPDPRFKGRKELVITNLPIPDNFYAWNTKDRIFLVISIGSIFQFFSNVDGPSIEEFIVRMVQRMTVFAVIKSLNPLTVHSDTSVGCLFDFNYLLRGVVDVVENQKICPLCSANIVEDGGEEFYEKLSSWVKSTPSGSESSAMNHLN